MSEAAVLAIVAIVVGIVTTIVGWTVREILGLRTALADVASDHDGHEKVCEERQRHIATQLTNIQHRHDELRESIAEHRRATEKKLDGIDAKLDRALNGNRPSLGL